MNKKTPMLVPNIYRHSGGDCGMHFMADPLKEPLLAELTCWDAAGAVTIPISPKALMALGQELIALGQALDQEGGQ